MKRYGGRVVFQTCDEMGTLQVVQDAFERALHFDSEPKQSAMDLGDPIRLVLSYTRAMLAPLLFVPSPRRILLIGLGGGSIAKFLLHHYPDAHVDVVELREKVVAVARDWFGLPEDKRLRVFVEDGGDFVRGATEAWDLVLVDAFDRRGIAYSVCGPGFFGALRERLRHGGLLAINLWSRDTVGLEDMIGDIGAAFDAPVSRLPVQGKDNVIAIAGAGPLPRRSARPLSDRARELESRLGLEFPSLLRTLRKHNPGY
ncbi:MAG: spermine synthase [Thiohalomonadaceae bacterium]